MQRLVFVAAAAAISVFAAPASAQTPAPAAAAAPPSPAPASPAPAPAPPSPAPGDPEARRFPIMAFKIVGNTTLPAADLEDAVMPFMGPDRSASDVLAAQQALATLYADRGLATVAVILPEQDIGAGMFRIEIVEQKVGRLRVTGARYSSPDAVARAAPSLAEGTVPDLVAVQRDIVALNQREDRTVTPELKAGAAPGTVDVDLKVSDNLPVHGSIELNNRSSVSTAALRLVASFQYDNLWGAGHSLSFGTQFAPERPDDTTVISGNYLARFADPRLTLRAGATYSNSDVAAVGGINVLGRGTTVSLRGAFQLPSGETLTHNVSAGADYKSFRDRSRVALAPSDPEFIRRGCNIDPDLPQCLQDFVTPVDYLPFSVAYQASWFGDKATTNASLALVFALRGIGSDTAAFDLKRFQAKPNFFYLRGNASTLRQLGADIRFSARLSAQYAPEPLISNEAFFLGGIDSVRGYFEAEALGDYGTSAQLELISPSLAEPLGKWVNDLRFHAFVDGGITAIYEPLPEQIDKFELVSIGLGARAAIFKNFNGTFEMAWPLIDGPSSPVSSTPVLKFRIAGEF
jgi:hemolysin activation/secretion protein